MKSNLERGVAALVAFTFLCLVAHATNYDEDKVGTYTLPDPLVLQNGKPVRDTKTWLKQRRQEILKLYQDNIHGHSPAPPKMKFDVWDADRHALDNKAVRKQIDITFPGHTNPVLHVLLYTPANAKGRVLVFLCLHFTGNHEITPDPAVKIATVWNRKTHKGEIPKNPVRGASSRWSIENTLARGYGIAAIYYSDIEPDLADGSG